jgi:hypothetical protein
MILVLVLMSIPISVVNLLISVTTVPPSIRKEGSSASEISNFVAVQTTWFQIMKCLEYVA